MTTRAQIELELRPATIADAEKVADLETARNPDDPRDGAMLRFWWGANPPDDVFIRLISEQLGAAIAFVMAEHAPWTATSARFGWARFHLHPDDWTEARYEQLVRTGESWVRDEGGTIVVARVLATFTKEVGFLERRGYREVRRGRLWELNLVANRERLLASAEESRAGMDKQGVQMLTLDRDADPDRLRKLYELTITAEQDIPTTVPMPHVTYDTWHHIWLENPGMRADRIWIAREGDAIVGVSALESPPTRGLPVTALTATSPSVRGRGIARALKYESVAQAIALGVERVRTHNDGENAPILHLNAEMGYAPIDPVLELHRELSS